MKFHEKGKRNLFRFIDNAAKEESLYKIREYFLFFKELEDFDMYFNNVIKNIDTNKSDNNYDAAVALAIISGLYYGRDLSIKHLERDYETNLPREELREKAMTFTKHILFGKEGSGLDQVGDLRIEKDGIVNIMDRIIASGISEEEQKIELMSYLRPYGIISEKAMEEARAAIRTNPDVILASNTNNNRIIESTHNSSFVGKVENSIKKTVTFSL